MLKSIFTSVLCFVLVYGSGQGIEFFEGHWEEAIELAAQEEKILFVDAYTTWCGPCKRMSKQVFPDKEVGKFYNANFISIKVDMESEAGRAFNKIYRVSSYPTFLFLGGDGELIHRISGYRTPEPFIDLGKLVLRKDDRSTAMQEEYDNGNREYSFMLKYIKALNRAGKSSLKVSNDYLLSKPEITKKEKSEFLFEATTEADSRLFDEMIKHRKLLASFKTEDQLANKITTVCNITVQKAIEFQSEDLLKEAQIKHNKYVSKKAKSFTIESNMKFFEAIGEIDKFFKEVKKYVSHVISNDAKMLISLSKYIAEEYRSNSDGMGIAEETAKKAVKVYESVDAYMNFSRILLSNGKKDEAIRNANKALSIAKLNGENAAVVERFVKYLESD